MMGYKEDMNSGIWQRKRLDIMNRDHFQCRVCGKENNLTVHHLYYLPNTRIFDYDDEALVTLCKPCHSAIHVDLAKIAGIIAFRILCSKFDVHQYSLDELH